MNKCRVSECPRPQRTNRYCGAHYHQMYVYGEIRTPKLGPVVPKGKYVKNTGKCKVSYCDSNQRTKELCTRHYQRMMKAKETV